MDSFGTVNAEDFDRNRQRDMDRTLLVKFFYKPRQDEAATQQEGRPIFTEVVYIDIRTPGDRDNVCRPASGRDIERFREHYDAFINRTSGPAEQGTPLTEWSQVSRAQVEELAYFNVKTVEQLASISDSNAQKFQGINMLRTKARSWLETSKADNVKAQVAERDAQIADLQQQLLAVQQQINNITPTVKRKVRGAKVKVNGAKVHGGDSPSHG